MAVWNIRIATEKELNPELNGTDADVYRTRNCPVCGEPSLVYLSVDKVTRYQSGEAARDIWPDLTPEDRALIISGAHAKCIKAPEPPAPTIQVPSTLQ